MSLEILDAETRALLGLAAAVGLGQEAGTEAASRTCVGAGVPALWVEELLLQSVLMVGWPRALMAFAAWRAVAGPAQEPGENGAGSASIAEWQKRGEAVCREVYGKNYSRLRENVRALHPALEAWMVTEGYGRTLGRPGLDLARRELCTVVQVALQGAERQLHSHLRGALNAGASPAVVAAALEVVQPLLETREWESVMALWDRVRA